MTKVKIKSIYIKGRTKMTQDNLILKKIIKSSKNIFLKRKSEI